MEVECLFCRRMVQLSEARHPMFAYVDINKEWICKDSNACNDNVPRSKETRPLKES